MSLFDFASSTMLIIALIRVGVPFLRDMIDRRSKTAVTQDTVARITHNFDDMRLTLTEHSIKISHLEQASEKHDTRLDRLENTPHR